jgi:urocanate hydratase
MIHLNGYVPKKMSYENAVELRKSNPGEYIKQAKSSIVDHVKAMLDIQKKGAVTFDYGNNIRVKLKIMD